MIWIDLDEDGDFSHSGMYGDEMVVDNKGGHGQRNRIGTRFLGRKSPIFYAGWSYWSQRSCDWFRCYQLSTHSTFEEEKVEFHPTRS